MIHDTQSAQISQKQDDHNVYVIMKTMCPPDYHHNGVVATHEFGHMMYVHTYKCMSSTKPLITGRVHGFHDNIYIYIYNIYIYI